MFEASFQLVFKYNDSHTNINVHTWRDPKLSGLTANWYCYGRLNKILPAYVHRSAQSFPASNKAAVCVIVE
jgi:hypothetical protein